MDDDRTARRLDAIDAIGLVDGPPDAVFERAARLASALLGATVTHTTLVLDDRQFYPSHVGLPESVAAARGTPLDYSFCQHVVAAETPLAFDDTLDDARLVGNRAVAEFGVRSYAGVPLRSADGTVVGTVCALELEPRQWTAEELGLLEDVAEGLRTELVLRREVDRLRDLRQQRLAGGLIGVALRNEAGRLRGGVPPTDVAGSIEQLAQRLGGPGGE
jgi:hypothetical protein